MRGKLFRQLLILVLLCQSISVISQNVTSVNPRSNPVLDSLKSKGVIINERREKPEIKLTVGQSIKYLQQRYQSLSWTNLSDPFRQAMGQLIFNASNPPVDSTIRFMKRFPFDSLYIPWDKFFIWEPMRVRIPVSTIRPIPEAPAKIDTAAVRNVSDSALINYDKAPQPEYAFKSVTVQKDTSIMVVIDTLHEVTSSYQGFPFRYLDYPYQTDSIKVAVNELLKYIQDRDSTMIYFTGTGKLVTPVWLNSRSDKYVRYWLKNDLNDSVTVWIGNPSRDTLGLYLEKEVTFRRPPKQGNYSDARINVKEVDKSKLLELQKVYIKPKYWKERLEANFLLNQVAISNWVKGGENSISTTMDITEYLNYENKPMNLSSSNFIRLKLGFLASGGNSIRKNLDLLETNSKLNHRAFGKFDFSAILLFKTQVAPGKDYSVDPAKKVSKFLDPAILTIGLGLDYKPNKTTSINFSPLTYRGTYMIDTVGFDQTRYGIPKDKKALHEPGVSLMVTNDYKPVKSVTVTNRLQLFTNYIHNPQNVDVDWEMIATINLNWFSDVRFNTHLIYDDDARTPVLGKNKQPILNPDGTPKKNARAQFKEILGLSAVFRF